MTRVYLERDGNQYTVSCKDHADSEASCASVSTLLYTLAGYLHNIADLCEIEDERLEPGDARICFRSSDVHITLAGDKTACYDADTIVQAAFDMICVGFLQLEASYPGAASVVFQEIA